MIKCISCKYMGRNVNDNIKHYYYYNCNNNILYCYCEECNKILCALSDYYELKNLTEEKYRNYLLLQ